jgi:hypothetical protein
MPVYDYFIWRTQGAYWEASLSGEFYVVVSKATMSYKMKYE